MVAMRSNPICDDDASCGVANVELIGPLALLTVTHAQVLDDRRVHLGRDTFWPAGGIEEVARAQEVDEKGQRRGVGVEVWHAGEMEELLGGAFQLAAREVNLLLNVGRLVDLVKVLDADEPAAHGAVLAVVRPVLRINAPAPAVVFPTQGLVDAEAADQHDAPATIAEVGDARLDEPAVGVAADIAVAKVAAQVLVGALAGAFTLYRHEDGLRGVGVEVGIDVGEHVGEVLVARQRDGEDGVDEGQVVVIWAG
ncbi:1-phosphatidylinositol phosphodiesterase [Colletotrichum asianum]